MNAFEDALRRAQLRDQHLFDRHFAIRLDPPKKVWQQIRAYLIARQDDGHRGTDLYTGLNLPNRRTKLSSTWAQLSIKASQTLTSS